MPSTIPKGDLSGFEYGMLNCAGSVSGGLVNHTKELSGFQFGAVNITRELRGLQLGLVNIATGKDSWQVLPIINANW
ncbi:MAG: hypothetical protein GKR87_05865 [Kiritimatiellae bacterium]|nr:hypothetical protein [Kiritimatiellia bacterium]